MKKLIVIVAVLFLTSCETQRDPNHVAYDYTCDRPTEIPDTMKGGTPIHWDCDWHASYVTGHVKILRDSSGRVTSIGREMITDE